MPRADPRLWLVELGRKIRGGGRGKEDKTVIGIPNPLGFHPNVQSSPQSPIHWFEEFG